MPFAGLGAVAAVELTKWFRERPALRWLAMVPPLLVLGVSLDGSGRIARYLVQPRYSLVQMSADVDKIVRQREGSTANVMLLGNMADTVAISTGMRAVNSSLGTVPLRDRLRRIHPAYVLLHTDADQLERIILTAGGRLTPLGVWDVFGNYYGSGQQVRPARSSGVNRLTARKGCLPPSGLS